MIAVISCNKTIAPVSNQRTTSQTIDSLKPVVLPADSSMMRALFECDSTGKVILRDYNELKSKGIETNVIYRDGELRYRVIVKYDTVYVPYRETSIMQECEPIIITKIQKAPLPWWQKVLMWMGGIWLIAFILLLIWLLRRIWITTAPRSR